MAGLFRLGPFVSLTELFLIPPPYFFFFTCTIWNLAIGFFLEITSSLVVTRPSFPNTQCVGIKTGMKAEQTHTPIKSVCVWGGGGMMNSPGLELTSSANRRTSFCLNLFLVSCVVDPPSLPFMMEWTYLWYHCLFHLIILNQNEKITSEKKEKKKKGNWIMWRRRGRVGRN